MNLPLPRWYREKVDPTPDGEDLRVSTLELFFDLVFVFTVTQLTHVLEHDFTTGLVQTVLMFAVIWWMYAGYAWLTNVIPPARPARRILLLAGMSGWFIVALAAPKAFHGTGGWFALGMAIVVVVHGLMYLQATTKFLSVFLRNLAGVAMIAAASMLHGVWPYLLFLGAVVVMWSSPYFADRAAFRLHPGHVAERHSLVVIIALGESIIAVGKSASAEKLTAPVLATAVLGLALAACLWWTFFTRDVDQGEHKLAASPVGAGRTWLVLSGYFYSHTPIILGIVGAAAGASAAIHDPAGPLERGPAMALSGGVAAFLIGTMLFRLSLRLPVGWPRAVAVTAALATIPLGLVTATWQLLALTAILMAMSITEHFGHRRLTQTAETNSLPPSNR